MDCVVIGFTFEDLTPLRQNHTSTHLTVINPQTIHIQHVTRKTEKNCLMLGFMGTIWIKLKFWTKLYGFFFLNFIKRFTNHPSSKKKKNSFFLMMSVFTGFIWFCVLFDYFNQKLFFINSVSNKYCSSTLIYWVKMIQPLTMTLLYMFFFVPQLK